MPWQAGAGQAGAGAEAVELRAPVLLRLHQDADAHQERRGRGLFVVGDAVRWRQLLVNVISNATKFTKFTKFTKCLAILRLEYKGQCRRRHVDPLDDK